MRFIFKLFVVIFSVNFFCISLATASGISKAGTLSKQQKPEIIKKGTIACHVVEATPFVYKDKVYRLEWVRTKNRNNTKGISYLHIVDHVTGEEISAFGDYHRFPCAFVENNTVYVVGTNENLGWHGTVLNMFVSSDLKNWEQRKIYDAPEELHQICNTSLCKTDEGYALMFEISGTKEAGVSFTPRFLLSKDLKTFKLTAPECTYGRDRYAAPHCLRFHDGWYYSFHLEAGQPKGYEQFVFRSKDLINWESSPFNSVLAASEEDRLMARDGFTDEEKEDIASSRDVNNSDIDFCEHKGKLVITYSWGDQEGHEFLAEAVYKRSMNAFLKSWFPKGVKCEKGK
ncbi:hypothetical protein [Sunxiuqinia sp. sy24]|uniref:hypothetical protein n=1 Tax=Sunxiuqinia sp. sy24 TaxID=3461495 RepID=UPI00404670D9